MKLCAKLIMKNTSLVAFLALLMLSACAPQITKETDSGKTVVDGDDVETEVVPDKGDPEARFTAALKKMKRGNLKEARADFFSLSQDFPEYPGTYINLGIIHQKQNRRDQAIGSYSKANKLDPKNLVALNLLAQAFKEDSNFVRAESTWKQAVDIDPGYTPALLNLGLMLESQNRNEEAIGFYQQYLTALKGEDLRVKVWIAELKENIAANSAVTVESAVSPDAQTGQ